MRFSKFFNQATKRVFTKEISGLVIPIESFTDPIEIMAVDVEGGKEYEIHYAFVGAPAPDVVTNPIFRLHGGVTFTGTGFNRSPDDPNLITNGTTEGEPWSLENTQRDLIVEDGILRMTMWIADRTDFDNPAPPTNTLEIENGILILREM